MFCPKCGNQIQENANFCPFCGESLTSNDLSNTQQSMNDGSSSANQPQAVSIPNNSNAKKKNGALLFIITTIAIAVVIGLYVGAKKIIQNNSILEDPPIRITAIRFATNGEYLTFEFDNISDKDISYIEFKTHYYDRMGNMLQTTFGTESTTFKYTGPLYRGEHDSLNQSYIFAMPNNTAAVYPKEITVTFFNDKQMTFENNIYGHTNDYYGGKLKD